MRSSTSRTSIAGSSRSFASSRYWGSSQLPVVSSRGQCEIRCPTQAALAWVGVLTFALSIADRSTGRGPFHEREQRQQPHPNVERHDVRMGHPVGQYDFQSKDKYKRMVLDTVQGATGNDVQHPSKGRTLFWNDKEGFAVWRDKYHPDQGTAYHPDDVDRFKKTWGLE